MRRNYHKSFNLSDFSNSTESSEYGQGGESEETNEILKERRWKIFLFRYVEH